MKPASANPLVHLELHTGDLAAACSFYERLLGWPAEAVHLGPSSYLALGTGADVGAGVVQCGTGRALWLPYVQVEDLARATDRARGLGAAVSLAPREGPAGWRSVVATPAGGELALWQPKR